MPSLALPLTRAAILAPRPVVAPPPAGYSPPGGVTTNLLLALDADELALADGASVSSWTDSSAVGNHATQATGTKQPTFRLTGGPNSLPCVEFDGGDGMVTGNVGFSGAAVTTYIVASVAVDGTDNVLIECSANTNSNVTGFLVYRTSANIVDAFIKGTGAISSNFDTTGTLQATPKLVATVFDRSLTVNEVTIWLNGSNAGTRSLNNNNTDTFGSTQPIYVGSRATTSLFLTGKIALVLVYNGAHDTTTRQTIEAAINTKYALGF